MTEIKQEISRHEAFLLKGGLVLTVILLGFKLISGTFHFGFLAGYALGAMCFVVLGKTVNILSKADVKGMVFFILSANLKLVILAAAVYLLKIYGFSVIEAILGIFSSHLVLFLSYFCKLLSDRQQSQPPA